MGPGAWAWEGLKHWPPGCKGGCFRTGSLTYLPDPLIPLTGPVLRNAHGYRVLPKTLAVVFGGTDGTDLTLFFANFLLEPLYRELCTKHLHICPICPTYLR